MTDLPILVSPSETSPLPPPPHWTSSVQYFPPLTVTIHSPPKSAPHTSRILPLLFLPDLALTSATFSSLLLHARPPPPPVCPELLQATHHFHVSLPGHDPDAATLTISPNFPDILDALDKLFEKFELSSVVGFGVGLGAHILIKSALEKRARFKALILVSPLLYGPGTLDRAGFTWDSVMGASVGWGLSRKVKDRLLRRWLSDDAMEENVDLVRTMEDAIDRLNPHNVLKVMEMEMSRDDISAKVAELPRCLLITGKNSHLRWHVADLLHKFNTERTAHLDVHDCGGLAHEEHSEEVAMSVALLLQGVPPVD